MALAVSVMATATGTASANPIDKGEGEVRRAPIVEDASTPSLLMPFKGISKGVFFVFKAERLNVDVDVAPRLLAAAETAAAAGVLAVETERRNLLWYCPPTVGGEARVVSLKSEAPLMGVVLDGLGGGGGGAKESAVPPPAEVPRGAKPNPRVGVTEPGRGLAIADGVDVDVKVEADEGGGGGGGKADEGAAKGVTPELEGGGCECGGTIELLVGAAEKEEAEEEAFLVFNKGGDKAKGSSLTLRELPFKPEPLVVVNDAAPESFKEVGSDLTLAFDPKAETILG